MRSIPLVLVACATAFGAASTQLGGAASSAASFRPCNLGPLQLRVVESDARAAQVEVVAADALADVSVRATLPGGEALVLAGELGVLEAGERRLVDVQFRRPHGATDSSDASASGLWALVTADARLLEADVPNETVAAQTSVVLREGRFASEAVPVHSARGLSLDVPRATGGAR